MIEPQIQRLIELRRRLIELDALTKEARAEWDATAEVVAEHFATTGTQNIKRVDATVYLKRQLYVGPRAADGELPDEAMARLKDVLRRHGYDDLIVESVSRSRLADLVRASRETGEALDPEMEQALDIREDPSVRVRLA